jgi:hypothetical protein
MLQYVEIKLWVFPVFSLFFVFSFFSVCFKQIVSVVSLLHTEKESFDVSIEPKQTETHPNSLKDSTFGYFSENLGLFGLFRFVTKQFC